MDGEREIQVQAITDCGDYCVLAYYETEERKPEPTPSAIPVSISLNMFERTGDISFYSSAICPIDDLSSPSAYNCGSKAITGDGKFEYIFRVVKFGIIGFR